MLVAMVDRMSKDEPPTDPFALSEEDLSRMTA